MTRKTTFISQPAMNSWTDTYIYYLKSPDMLSVICICATLFPADSRHALATDYARQ